MIIDVRRYLSQGVPAQYKWAPKKINIGRNTLDKIGETKMKVLIAYFVCLVTILGD